MRTIPQQTKRLTLTDAAVLCLLAVEGERSGYELLKHATHSVGYVWAPAKTQLYAVLPKLAASDLARRRSGCNRTAWTSSSTSSRRRGGARSTTGSRSSTRKTSTRCSSRSSAFAAASQPKELRWYRAGHPLTTAAGPYRDAWLVRQLR